MPLAPDSHPIGGAVKREAVEEGVWPAMLDWRNMSGPCFKPPYRIQEPRSSFHTLHVMIKLFIK